FFFFFSSRRRHTRLQGDWSSDVCSSDLEGGSAVRRTQESDRTSSPTPAEIKVRSRAILPGSGRPEHQTTGPLPQPSATIHPARDDLVVALRRRTPVDRNAHDRDSVSFRRSFFNTHA